VLVISRAVNSLARVGDELFVEPAPDYLLFRTVNLNQSAFAEFKMCRSFFSSFIFSPEDNEAKCKFTMKSCLSVFKNAHSLDKQVESCEIKYKPNGSVFLFLIKFTNSSVKKYFLPIIDTEAIEASFQPDDSNILTASSKFLASCLKNFRHSEDEVTIAVSKEKTIIKNHLELSRDANLMRTELSFGPSEFTSYSINNPTKITFCLKEFRAVLIFAEPSNLPVTMSFNSPGLPVIFQVVNHPAYEAKYVVSTLNSSDMSGNITPVLNELNSRQSRLESISPNQVSGGDQNRHDPFTFPGDIPEEQHSVARPHHNCSHTSRQVTDRNDEFKPVRNITSSDGEVIMDKECEVPSQLVETVFARCFRNSNCLDYLPGHDIILTQNSELK
ncbi:hypothetical protein AAG570_010858, partial [Ranatra chinensis]